MRPDQRYVDFPTREDIISLGSPLARHVECYPEIASTQVRAAELARSGLRDAIVVSAVQTGGKGRLGYGWRSPAGGLWMSVVISPELPADKAPRLTQSASVAVAKSLRTLGVDARIKWPNDVLARGRKVCGVLAESSTSRDPETGHNRLDYAVVGIGVNANLDTDSLPTPQSGLPPASIRDEIGEDVPLVELLASILENLDRELTRAADFRQTLHDLRALSCTLGKRVRVRRFGEIAEGIAADLTPEGALILETRSGPVELFEGDIEHIRETSRDHDPRA